MIKYFTTLQNERGDVLPSYRAQVTDSAGSVVTIYADKGGTRFTDASGNNVNYATADEKGRISFYFTPAVGQTLQTLDVAGNLQDGEADFADSMVLDTLPGSIAQSAVTDLVTDLGNKAATADLSSTDAGKGAALVGFKRTDTGAVARTVQARLADIRTAKDFGAVGDGVTDDSAAIQAAIDAGATTIPPGVYGIGTGLTIGDNADIFAEGVTFKALANNLTFITSGASAYFSRIIGLSLNGNGFTNVTGYNLTNFRLNTYISGHWEDMNRGIVYASGSFGSILENVSTIRVPYPVQVVANCSGLMILNPQFDNGATVSGTGTGTGIEIQDGDTGSGISCIGCIVQGGFIQGFDNGLIDEGLGTKVSDTYFETNPTADINANGARLSHYRGITHFGSTGAAAYKLRNCDGIKIEAPVMSSGGRTALYDIDSSNTFTVELREQDAGSLNTPTGSLTYVDRIAVQSKGTFSPTIIGSGTAGAGTYTTQSGKWTKTGDRVLVEIEVAWSAHTGTGNIIIGGIPSALNPASYTPRRMGPVIAPGVAIAGPHAYAYLNGSGGQATLVEVNGSGGQALVAIPASGTIYFTIEYSV